MSTVNMVRCFFYKDNFPGNVARVRALVALAYQTASDRKLYPKAILIRSEVHNTTSIKGMHEKDPLGWHVSICFKDEEHLAKGTHVSSHGYTEGKDNLSFVRATHDPEKADSTENRRGRPIWPSESELKEATQIGYGHLQEEGKK